MVGVAQLVELSVVVRAVAGSNPVAHPIFLSCLNSRFIPKNIAENRLYSYKCVKCEAE